MPIVGYGIDMVDMSRIESMLDKHGDAFLTRCFTDAECTWLSEYKFPLPHIAGRFAAKEAIVKALGTGFRDAISWLDMEILPDRLGKPVITLRGAAAERAAALGVRHWHISLSHTATAAVASVIAEI